MEVLYFTRRGDYIEAVVNSGGSVVNIRYDSGFLEVRRRKQGTGWNFVEPASRVPVSDFEAEKRFRELVLSLDN